MNAVTEAVDNGLQLCRGGASWTLYLDKLSFPRGARRAEDKGETLGRVLKVFKGKDAKSAMDCALARHHIVIEGLRSQYGKTSVREVHLQNSSRLLIHLALANPLENVGLYAERITGLPIIPGTAVKGVVSTWACWCQHIEPDGAFPAELRKERRSFLKAEAYLARRVLGDNSAAGSESAGEVVFFGAWPETKPSLDLDITTPHPNDGHSNPSPNPFLAVASGTDWRFVLLARPRQTADSKELLDAAEKWLTEALEQIGLGAKTAAGYGRFGVNPERQAKMEAERLTEEARQQRASLVPDESKLRSLSDIKNDQDLWAQVNLYRGDPRNWPSSDMERLAVLEFCRTRAWDRVKNNKNCRQALQRLAKAFNRELPT